MSGAVGTAVKAFEGLVTHHRERIAIRIHLGDARGEHEIRPQGLGELGIGLETLGILVQILVLTELDRVQKHADNRNITILHRSLDEGAMTFVERSHRRNETDCFSLLRKRFERFAKSFD